MIQNTFKYVERHIASRIQKHLKIAPVVLLIGPRQAGKTTLINNASIFNSEYQYITLDNLTQLNAAKMDPVGFVNNLQVPVIIDEVQRCLDIMLPIKFRVDTNKQKGMFLLGELEGCIIFFSRKKILSKYTGTNLNN